MKRCPQCNRVETDETLKFCRVDGVTFLKRNSLRYHRKSVIRHHSTFDQLRGDPRFQKILAQFNPPR